MNKYGEGYNTYLTIKWDLEHGCILPTHIMDEFKRLYKELNVPEVLKYPTNTRYSDNRLIDKLRYLKVSPKTTYNVVMHTSISYRRQLYKLDDNDLVRIVLLYANKYSEMAIIKLKYMLENDLEIEYIDQIDNDEIVVEV